MDERNQRDTYLDVGEVAAPELDVEDLVEATTEQLLHAFRVAAAHLVLDVRLPEATTCRKGLDQLLVEGSRILDPLQLVLLQQLHPGLDVVAVLLDPLLRHRARLTSVRQRDPRGGGGHEAARERDRQREGAAGEREREREADGANNRKRRREQQQQQRSLRQTSFSLLPLYRRQRRLATASGGKSSGQRFGLTVSRVKKQRLKCVYFLFSSVKKDEWSTGNSLHRSPTRDRESNGRLARIHTESRGGLEDGCRGERAASAQDDRLSPCASLAHSLGSSLAIARSRLDDAFVEWMIAYGWQEDRFSW